MKKLYILNEEHPFSLFKPSNLRKVWISIQENMQFKKINPSKVYHWLTPYIHCEEIKIEKHRLNNKHLYTLFKDSIFSKPKNMKYKWKIKLFFWIFLIIRKWSEKIKYLNVHIQFTQNMTIQSELKHIFYRIE